MARLARLTLALLAVAAASTTHAQTDTPRYLSAVEQELERLAFEPECDAVQVRATCAARRADTPWRLRVVVSDATETVVLSVQGLARIDPDGAEANAALRRVAELNWDLLGTRLEWDPTTGDVRLSAVLQTASNFDRRAFRTLVRLLLTQATRLQPLLNE